MEVEEEEEKRGRDSSKFTGEFVQESPKESHCFHFLLNPPNSNFTLRSLIKFSKLSNINEFFDKTMRENLNCD